MTQIYLKELILKGRFSEPYWNANKFNSHDAFMYNILKLRCTLLEFAFTSNITYPYVEKNSSTDFPYTKTHLSIVKATIFHVDDTKSPQSMKLEFQNIHSTVPSNPVFRI